MSTNVLRAIFCVVAINSVRSLLLDSIAQSKLQTEVDELRQKVQLLEQEVKKLQNTTVVAFLAEVDGSALTNLKIGQHIIFNNVHLNAGNGYHNDHGVFIPPVSGVYHITVAATISGGANTATHIHIMTNGARAGYIFFDNLPAQWLKNRESIIIHLEAGNEVWTQITHVVGSPTIQVGDMHTYMSGFIINRD